MDLELVTVPGLGTLTARLVRRKLISVLVPNAARGAKILADLRVVTLRTLVGRRTGPLTRSCLSFALLMRSVETGHKHKQFVLGQ